MCVIIVKKAGANVPTKKQLLEAYRANPNGCGFAVYQQKNKAFFGFKSVNFNEFYKRFKSNVSTADNAIIHFRLATHGSICANNCHPFVNKEGTLYFAHNGILPIESVNNQTDSQILFDNVLAGAAKIYGIESNTFKAIVKTTIGLSKFAFLDENNVYIFGDFENVNGLYYSNLRGIYSARFTAYYNAFEDYDYRSDGFYTDLFAKHNQPYKRAKFSFK